MSNSLFRAAVHGVVASLIVLPLMASPASAQDAAMTPQQKMAACSTQNKGKKGDDYKQAQSSCLKNGPTTTAAATPMTPQQRMAMCSKQNKGKKGDDYKQAQSTCLKG